jgi:solute:Na+ symporter, SSS family
MEAGVIVWGLHVIDWAIVVVFLLAILAIGFLSSRSVKKESDFYLGGRKLGRTLQFFLQFGNATDSIGAPTIATSVYRQGVGGAWLGGFQTLFITPFFWFTQPWFRRARLTTMADLFVDRFDSRSLATAYAAYNIFIALFNLGVGNVASYKVASAMVIKPESAYTQQDRQEIDRYNQFRLLNAQVVAGRLSPQSEPFKTLDSENKRGELASSISYIKPLPFYIAYSLIVCTYISLGGLKAAAITDALQGLLILVMSVLLIPIGLAAVHGFTGLHQRVPEYLFLPTSNLAWYSVAVIVAGSLLQILGIMHNMSTAGSATNENTARFGMISGGFTKRLVIIAWILCGLLALGILSGPAALSDPDNAWGALSKSLLAPGLMGLMLSGMLLGHMPQVGVACVAVSGLATRNIYEPLFKNRTETHYLRVGQAIIGLVLAISVVFAMMFSDLFEMFTFLIRYGIFFGAVVFLLFFWRRLTAAAVMMSFVIWVVGLILVPTLLPYWSAAGQSPALLAQTEPYKEKILAGATADDVAVGAAQHIGQPIEKDRIVLPMAVYFDKVVPVDPGDPKSPLEGLGRFNVETYTLSCLGLRVTKLHNAGLTTAAWLFDSVLPFFAMILFSLITKPGDAARADRFYVKMKTPVGATPQEDRREVEISHAEPHRFDRLKLFPRSQLEFTKWTVSDVQGFFGCWTIVGLILLLLWGVLKFGS